MFLHPVSCVTFENGGCKDLLLRKRHNGKLWAQSKIDWVSKWTLNLKEIEHNFGDCIFLIECSIVCQDALSLKTSTHLVQTIEVQKRLGDRLSNQDFF